jgi:hypothetical protein
MRTLLLLLLVPALALAGPSKKKAEAEPLDELIDESKAEWLKRLKAAKPGADCSKLITPDTRFDLTQADPTPAEVKKDLPAYVTMARCAEKEKFFVLLLDIAQLIHKAAPKDSHPEFAVRALIGLNLLKEVDELLPQALAEFPTDADLVLSAAKLKCRQRDWTACDQYASQAMTLAEKKKDPKEKDAIVSRASKYQARVALHKGDFTMLELNTLLVSLNEDMDPSATKALEDSLVAAKTYLLVVEPEFTSHLALGVYHLTGKVDALPPPVKVVLTNIGEDRQVRVEASVAGVTSTATKTVPLRAGKEAAIELTPPLLPSFDPSTVRATKTGSLELKVTSIGTDGKEVTVLQESRELALEPRDFLPMSAAIDKEKRVKKFSYVGAWVTPNAKAVDAFLTDAKKSAPGASFSGEQSATVPQVKALFEALKAKGVSYVMDPNVMSGMGFGQRTRLPSEVLTSTNAQCLEGTLLYASLFEAIGLKPVVVFIPGHAFVGWRGSKGDGENGEKTVFFLETTMTHGAEFEQAIRMGKREYENADEDNEATVLILDALRKQGITPQPYD